MISEQLTFPGSTGAHLSGVLSRPDDGLPTGGSVLLAHCFTCSKDFHTMTRLSRGLVARGYAVLRFDFTGLGESAGAFATSTVTTQIGDLVQAATVLIKRGYGPCAMVGHSLGGAATLLAAHRLKTVRSVVVIGAPSTPEHVRGLFANQEATLLADGEAIVTIGGRPFPLAMSFVEDLALHTQASRLADLGRPLLIIHAVDDQIVDIAQGEANFAAARQPKAFVPLLDADHLLTSRASADQALALIGDWLDRTR